MPKTTKAIPLTHAKIKEKKANKPTNSQLYDEARHALYCEALEEQYQQAKEEGLFEVLKILQLDKKHSDSCLVEAIDYFNDKDGVVENDAPIGFLSEHEKKIVNQNGEFRPNLYCMLLSKQFADAIENKSAFIKHSLKFSFTDNEI